LMIDRTTRHNSGAPDLRLAFCCENATDPTPFD
jgi:hypothetical protein